MVERITSLLQQSADKADTASLAPRGGKPFADMVESTLQQHKGGIGMGVVGLLIGVLATNPLLAFFGLVGGMATGTWVLDRRPSRVNPVANESVVAATDHRQSIDSPDWAPSHLLATEQTRPAALFNNSEIPASTAIRFDGSFSEVKSTVTSGLAGKPGGRRNEIA